jgi:hypothetical protein
LPAGPEQQATAIVPTPVMPLVSPDKAAEQWKLFEALKAKLLNEEDYQTIVGKRYIKRSGFRKIAVYFGISDRILKEERTQRDDGSFFWKIEVEAYAPNGRSCVGVGACDSRERKFAHTEHDCYATAHTRAKSRAISDLVAGGAVSAEEVEVSTEQENGPVADSSSGLPNETSGSLTEAQNRSQVPTAKDPLKMLGLRQFPLTDGLKSVGMLNVLGDEITIVPEKPLKIDGSTIASFLIPRVLEPMAVKHCFSFSVMKNENGDLSHIYIKGKLTDEIIKDLQTPSRWAFAKAMENTEQQK